MVHTTKLLRLAKITSTTVGPPEKALYTPRGLYKFLFRRCDKLPNKEVKLYYKHHIRQSYNQHADETDSERVSQIINQAVKDSDWVLKKVVTKLTKMQPAHPSDNCEKTDELIVEANVSGPVKFFHSLSTFTSRPELIVPHIRSTDIDWNCVKPDERICYRNNNCETLFDFLYSPVHHVGKCITSANVGEFSGSLQHETVELLLKSNSKKYIKRLIHHKPLKDSKSGWTSSTTEEWDFSSMTVTVTSANDHSRSVPYVPFISFEANYFPENNTARITLKRPTESFENDVNSSFEFFFASVIPKVIEWMQDDYNVEPPKLSRLRARPLTYVNNKDYWSVYDLIKSGPAETIKKIWQESTDPVKFIHEDIGIAAYIASFIYENSGFHREWVNENGVEIIDLGCGNGLLCFFLSHILSIRSKYGSVAGFDIRRRRIWQDLIQENTKYRAELSLGGSENNSEFKLLERSFVPHIMDDLILRYSGVENREKKSLWIIGNHSDELTPWIPLVARRLNASGFFIIPCCPFDFFKKYQRVGNLPGSSIYQNYIEYICKVGDDFGYRPTLEKLRIPSTKNICLVGVDCRQTLNSTVLSSRVTEMINKLKQGDAGNPISKFVPRTVESAKESPKIDRNVAAGIVKKIFLLLIQDWKNESKEKWYTGRNNLTFHEITSALTTEEKAMLKGKGNGLRTLIKSNKHLFTLDGHFVKLRMPNDKDMENVSDSSRDRIKTRVCYFFANHPQGCPLPNELCTFIHEN